MARADRQLSDGRIAVYRHPAVVRLAHWTAVLSVLLLLLSGLQIFNAHPALYLGKASDFDRPILSMQAQYTPDYAITGGVTRLFGREFQTTGLFGASNEGEGLVDRGFPRWITFPPGRDLATARLWHFLFAWIFVVAGGVWIGYRLAAGRRALVPSGGELRGIGRSIREHARFHLPKGEAARGYNVLQKLSYLLVLLVLLPLMVATGMSMSPGLNAALPWLPELFGGRQGARTVHFIVAWSIVLFVLVHVVMVFAAGVVNEMRSMITGRYVIDPKEDRP